CSTTLNETFGQIDFKSTSFSYIRCYWIIQSAGVRDAVALISVQELNIAYCSEQVKITDGNATQVFYHRGCESFAPEIISDVNFGLSNNITVQLITLRSGRSLKIKFAILKKGLTSAILVSGWNVTLLNATFTSFTLQWTRIDTSFYIIEVKSINGTLLGIETVPGNATTTNIKGMSPSTKYRVVVYGIDRIGQPYKSLESAFATKK
ncbi:hypothetical protein OS493_027018, partial [Desmophyllum pertusum]